MPTCFALLLLLCCQMFVPCHSRPMEDTPPARSKRAININLAEIPQEAREEIELFITNCGKSYDLSIYAPASDDPAYDKEGQGLSFGLPFLSEGKYLTGFDCTYSILGEEGCRPMFQCTTLDIRQLDPDCTKEFLEVSDGLGGLERYCGRAGPTKWMQSIKPSYDLYVRYVINNSTEFDRPYGGIVCAAFCQPEGEQKKRTDPIPKPLARNGKRIFDSKCVCGIRKGGRVVGGTDVTLNEFPWQTAMVMKNTRYIRCGASLLNDLYVLTAAHCVIEGTELISPKEIDVLFHVNLLDQFLLKGWSNVSLGQAGSIQAPGWNMENKTDAEEGTIRRAVKSIVAHPNYNLQTMDYDVAILKLKKRVNLDHAKSPVVPVCLPPNLMPESEIQGKTLTVVGWGLADESAKGSTRLLQKLDMPYYSEEECVKITEQKYTERMLCAGHKEGGRDACTGDSGGPLIMRRVHNKLTQFTQVGIVSYGEGCARADQLGAYTRVSVVVPWILHVTPLANWCLEEPTKEMIDRKNAPSTTTSAPLLMTVCTNKDGKCLKIFDKT